VRNVPLLLLLVAAIPFLMHHHHGLAGEEEQHALPHGLTRRAVHETSAGKGSSHPGGQRKGRDHQATGAPPQLHGVGSVEGDAQQTNRCAVLCGSSFPVTASLVRISGCPPA
jgi:hypothetical protein